MGVFRFFSDGYLDSESEFEYKNIENFGGLWPILHDHDYYEFFLVADGSVMHLVNDARVLLKKGQLVFIRPTDTHTFEKVTKSKSSFINVAILEKTINELFEYLGRGFNRADILEPFLPVNIQLSTNELVSLLQKFQSLNTIPVNDKAGLNVQLRIILTQIFSEFFIRRSVTNTEIPEWLSRVVLKLQRPENLSKGKEVIKESAFKSDEHISRSFKKHFNKTPTQYINELRLNYTANQIRYSNRKIPDIAFESGFENLSYFYRQFKIMFSYTPYEFRKAHQEFNNGKF
jgi:AraC family transcriptional regulator, dual regulator of chb operon